MREKDTSNFSYFHPKYKIKHDFIRVYLLPAWNEIKMDNIADKRPIKVYYTSKDTIQDLKRKIAIYLSNQNPHFSYTEEDLRFWKPDFTYQNISSFVSFLESKDLSNGEAITFPTELGEKGKDGNPQAVNDEDCEANVEVNTGVEFPGLQMDIFFKSKIVDF